MSKTALVTGAGQGLGLSFVKEALDRGYEVAALELKNFDALNDLKKSHGEKLQVFPCDITDLQRIYEIKDQWGKDSVDLLINNAGRWLEKGRKKLEDEDFSFDNILPQYETNAVGMLKIAKVFMPLVVNSMGKTVVNISSEAGSVENAFRVCEYGYCMSKAALNMASKILQNAYEDRGVKVYCFHPGWMQTPQGMAGVEDPNNLPEQSPDTTADVILNIAESEPLPSMYYQIDGREVLPFQW